VHERYPKGLTNSERNCAKTSSERWEISDEDARDGSGGARSSTGNALWITGFSTTIGMIVNPRR